MARRSAVSLVAASLLGLTACGDQAILNPTAASGIRMPGPTPTVQAARYLVGFDGTPEIPASVLAASGGAVVDAIPSMNVLVVEGVTNPDALKLAQPKYIETEFEVSISPIASDVAVTPGEGTDAVPVGSAAPWFATNVLWDMKVIHADDGWARTSGGLGTKACIVDTGVDAEHQELSGRVLARANFVNNGTATDRLPGTIYDPNGHGSHVSGTVAGAGVVVSGVAPQASVLGARVLNKDGSGTESAIVNGINWCVANGAHVINMSIGGVRYKGTAAYASSPVTYGNAIKAANDAGVVVVVSAGNDNLRLPNPIVLTVPAQVAGVVMVGATGPLTKSTAPAPPAWSPFDPAQVWHGPDNKAYYSNFGDVINVFAPGGRGGVPISEVYRTYNGAVQGGPNDNIWSLCSGQTSQSGVVNSPSNTPGAAGTCLGATNRYIAYAGTSMAAPHVTGMAAVLYGELGNVRSAANRARVENCIKSQTDDIGPATTYGGGRVNLAKAIDALRAGSC